MSDNRFLDCCVRLQLQNHLTNKFENNANLVTDNLGLVSPQKKLNLSTQWHVENFL